MNDLDMDTFQEFDNYVQSLMDDEERKKCEKEVEIRRERARTNHIRTLVTGMQMKTMLRLQACVMKTLKWGKVVKSEHRDLINGDGEFSEHLMKMAHVGKEGEL